MYPSRWPSERQLRVPAAGSRLAVVVVVASALVLLVAPVGNAGGGLAQEDETEYVDSPQDTEPTDVDPSGEQEPWDDAPDGNGTEQPAGDSTPDGGTDDGSAESADPPVTDGPATAPALSTSEIYWPSVLLAGAVLMGALLLIVSAARAGYSKLRQRRRGEPNDAASDAARARGRVDAGPAVDRTTLVAFLLELGEALTDAGNPVNVTDATLQRVAAIYGVDDASSIVLPTVMIISLPSEGGVQTGVARAGAAPLRLDQVDRIFQIVNDAEDAKITPAQGRQALEEVRSMDPPYRPAMRLVGYVLFTAGLAMALRSGWPELVLAVTLGVLIGGFKISAQRLPSSYTVFAPLVGAFLTSAFVFGTVQVFPDLDVFPPLVAPLVAFLPGALLTTGTFELATGQQVSGAARLAAGGLQLALLAAGIVAGAALIGVPSAPVTEPATQEGPALLPWVGTAVFGVGVMLFNGARRTSLPWMLLVLYVAYAGQVLGGLVFGSALSAFFGALLLTPVAIVAAQRPSGPPALVSFLPAFWMLVPGALGLQGVTQFLNEDSVRGIESLADVGISMLGITLGVLLGLAIGSTASNRLAGEVPESGRVPAASQVLGG